MPSILVCTPALSGDMNFQFVLSLIKLDRLCRENNIDIDYCFVAHESLIPRARNYLCHQFLQTDRTHLLFLDADIEFVPSDIMKMINSNVPLIGGVYPKKKLKWECLNSEPFTHMAKYLDYVVVPISETDLIDDINSPFAVKYVGTGMLLIQREVLEAMNEHNSKNNYHANGVCYHLFFDCIIHDGQYLSEDYYFCEMWRRLGGTVYAAFWTRATHWGLLGYEGDVSKTVS